MNIFKPLGNFKYNGFKKKEAYKTWITFTSGVVPEDVLKWTETCKVVGIETLFIFDACNKIKYTNNYSI
jgi:hypothetical protein